MSEVPSPNSTDILPKSTPSAELVPAGLDTHAQALEILYLNKKKPRDFKPLIERATARSKELVSLGDSGLVLCLNDGATKGRLGVFTEQSFAEQLQVVRLLPEIEDTIPNTMLRGLSWFKTLLGTTAVSATTFLVEISLDAPRVLIGGTFIIGVSAIGVRTWLHHDEIERAAQKRVTTATDYLENFRDSKPDVTLSKQVVTLPSDSVLSQDSRVNFSENVEQVLLAKGLQSETIKTLTAAAAKLMNYEEDTPIQLGVLHALELLVSNDPAADWAGHIQEEAADFIKSNDEIANMKKTAHIIDSTSDSDESTASLRDEIEKRTAEMNAKGAAIAERVVAAYDKAHLKEWVRNFKEQGIVELLGEQTDPDRAWLVLNFSFGFFGAVEELCDAHPVKGPCAATDFMGEVCASIDWICRPSNDSDFADACEQQYELLASTLNEIFVDVTGYEYAGQLPDPATLLAPKYRLYRPTSASSKESDPPKQLDAE